ncbi:hypothetical protein PIROE2DRAFT_17510 [Piromyces sp. E2]|nr:hypothetical protein PIROE2DRAFT_17510 [Piromyces sp. E2]|eukprot:OUM57490.1 hypothetical protein PIROE2DRAFT_17510 [Piromyces sp. E2]
MKSISFLTLVLTSLVNYTIGIIVKGSQSSFAYFSKETPFKYTEIDNLIAFGDSYTTLNADYSTMRNNGNSIYESKNWPLFLLELNPNLKIWNYAQGGAVVTKEM